MDSYFDLDLDTIKEEENFIRDNLYGTAYTQHEMNIDPYYGLIPITEDLWTSISIQILGIKHDPTLYFSDARDTLRKRITRSWNNNQCRRNVLFRGEVCIIV